MPRYIDQDGNVQEVQLDAGLYKAALDSGLTVPQFINRKYPTHPKAEATTFEQMCADVGLILAANQEFGLRSPTLAQVFDGTAEINAGVVVKEADPASRIMFPAVILEMIENKLQVDRTTDPTNFNRMLALDTSVTQDRVERPVINYEKVEKARAKAITQLAKPTAMMSITVSDTARAVPTFSIGLEISDQALRASTLDLVELAVRRQALVERAALTNEYLLALLQGDVDMGDAALPQVKANTFDSSITTAGTLTKTAIVKWLLSAPYTRKIDWIVTDLDGLLAFEKALENTNTNQHILTGLVPEMSVVNRMIERLNFFVMPGDSGWPANTLMGLDSSAAIQRIRNSAAAYSAVEEFVLRRSRALRFDFAEIVFRLFDDAFSVLSLTV